MINFDRLATGIDVSPLVQELHSKPELYSEIDTRQKYSGTAHADTESIFLRWCKGLDLRSAFTEIPAFDYPAMGSLASAHELINYTIRRVSATELGRILIVRLRPGGRILPHADEGAYADYYERFHVVLESTPGTTFTCEDESVEMRTGELWCFNHKREHQVRNLSHTPRTHMIIDAVAPKFRRERAEVSHAV